MEMTGPSSASTASDGASGELVRQRLDWLDALRGWAIMGVVLVHAGQAVPQLAGPWKIAADAGQYGVQLFFVVSALTISLTYGQFIRRNGNSLAATLSWLAKRYFRIAPLYYFGIALYLGVLFGMRWLGSEVAPYAPRDLLFNLLFLHEWIPSAQNSVVPGGWSIGVEMFFYLLVPLIFRLTREVVGAAGLFCIALTAAVLAGRWLAPAVSGTPDVVDNSYLYFWFPTQLPVFLAGFVLVRTAGGRLWRERSTSAALSIAAVAGFAGSAAAGIVLGSYGNLNQVLGCAAMGVAFCFLVLVAIGQARPLLVNALTVALGRISYSVYINHFLVILLLRWAIKHTRILHDMPQGGALVIIFGLALAAAAAMSIATFRCIEAPGIAFGKLISERLARRITASRRRARTA
jgi:peptidoglycan/LPS O-acetylase OafA/YrhL